jgi:S-adenosyl-L-methionine hydrolase (adenosine-forming)
MRTWSRSLLSAEFSVAAFRPSGVITLTTDFGLREPFVGVMKGVIHSRAPAVKVIDLAHDSPAFEPLEAGFWLARSWQYFPVGTVHVAVVDPGVGTERAILVVEVQGHLLLAPDNGLLAPLAAEGKLDSVRALGFESLHKFGIDVVSATFHGRDIFAPVAAELAAGRCQPQDLGTPANIAHGGYQPAKAERNLVEGVVVAVDRFGNLITNIERDMLVGNAWGWAVTVGSRKVELRHTYGHAEAGEYLALVNSFGVLEVARCEGSAFEGLGVGKGAAVRAVFTPENAPKNAQN